MEYQLIKSVLLISFFDFVFPLQPKEVCLLQMDEGPCRGDVQRYYYNTITQQCEEFGYGGCMGNANNFMTFQQCQKTCWRIPKIPQICRFKADVGPCRALHSRYFFNMTSMQCEQFHYGGCRGNENRFQDPQSCTEYCKPHTITPVICLDPLDKGRCSASITRYYYNTVSKMCEEFIYTGCGGSSNNFVERQSCMNVCAKGGRPLKYKKKPSSRTLQNRIRRKFVRTRW